MNKRQSPANGDSAVILFGPGDYCALTKIASKLTAYKRPPSQRAAAHRDGGLLYAGRFDAYGFDSLSSLLFTA